MALVRSAIRRASRKGGRFATPWGGMAERRPQRVAMQGRRAGRHSLISSHLGDRLFACVGIDYWPNRIGFVGFKDCCQGW
jgi:hypothetical protein